MNRNFTWNCISCYSLVLLAGLVYGSSKYGKTCDDIGCMSNQKCVIKQTPCDYYSRSSECGDYPTCVKISNEASSCTTYVCPPSQVCRMKSGHPTCDNDHSKKGHIGYDTSAIASSSGTAGGLYPSLSGYRGETTPRPNINNYQSNQALYNYAGGAVNSGYPGRAGYPGRVGSAYPHAGYQQTTPNYYYHNGYHNQQQPAGYNNRHYNTYPTTHQQNYPYNNGYGGYNAQYQPGGQQRYYNGAAGGAGSTGAYGNNPSKSSSAGESSIADKLKGLLKLGAKYL